MEPPQTVLHDLKTSCVKAEDLLVHLEMALGQEDERMKLRVVSVSPDEKL